MLSTKIHPPRHRDGLLVRPRLLAAVADQTAPLVLVTGPAGSGKTVLVRQWLDQLQQPAAWLTVDPRDNDPARFWMYLAGAVTATLPNLAWAAGGQVTAESIEDLASRLATFAPLTLVLDDLHFLVESEVIDQLGHLVDALPHEIRLVLVSRAIPALRLARRRALGELVEVGGRELLFTGAETGQLLGRAGNDALAAAVQDSTGGWPVAVGFATHLPDRDTDQAARSTPTSRSRQQIADYLTEEVLRAQPADVQHFLLDTSVLDELTAAAANAVRDTHDAAAHLHHLERHDIFLTPLDGTGEDTWRHHALVRDHLRRTLERTQPDHWTHLHTQAARHYTTHDPERAISHALAAPAYDLAADLIEATLEQYKGVEHRASRDRPLRWLEALPDHIHTEREALRSTGLSLAASVTRLDLVERWLAARPPGNPKLLEELFAEAWQADIVGDMPRVAAAGRRALALCEPDSSWWYAIHNLLGPAEHMMGEPAAEIETLTALQFPLPASLTAYFGTGQEFFRALVAVHKARLGAPDAASALQLLRDWLAEAACRGYQSVGIADWAEAMVALHAGDIGAASRWESIPEDAVVDQGPLPPMIFRLDQARVRRAAGDNEQAARLLADVRRRLAGYADAGRFPDWVAAEEAALGITRLSPQPPAGVAGLAAPPVVEQLSQRELDVLRMLRSEFSVPEIASHLFVSYNTAKTHTRAIYRKLGVGSRSAAVARARSLGYL